MGSKTFESPLISHARMRALYRALAETRVLSERASKGRGAVGGWPRNLEACWVATAIDLKSGDLTSVSRGQWLVDHVRSLGLRAEARAASAAEAAGSLRALAAEKCRPAPLEAIDRMLCAVGMAMAVKAASAQGVVTAWLANDDLTPAEWRRLLHAAMDSDLPLVIVATPGANDLSAIVKRMGVKHIPVIPVDAGDVVALYRVAQETYVRGRADGGVVVIECVDCGTDPVTLMGGQLVKKKICTERWVAEVEAGFRKRLSKS